MRSLHRPGAVTQLETVLKQISVPVMSTTVVMLLGTNSAVAFRHPPSALRQNIFTLALYVCSHAPTEDKNDTTKDDFYDKLEVLYNRCPRSDIKMLVGDFNAKVGREGIFGPTVRKHYLH